MQLLLLAWISILTLFSVNLKAAACCGGGSSVPSLILGDEAKQFSSSFSDGFTAIENVDSNGIWYKSNQHKQIQNLQFNYSQVFKDRWQWGLQVPIGRKVYRGKEYSGLGDTKLSLAYEYITDWDYHPYKPKAIAYLAAIIPSGITKFESDNSALDVFGKSFWGVSVGSSFSKNFIAWDIGSSIELRKYFPKYNSNSNGSEKILPGMGSSLSAGFGYNWEKTRLGFSLDWVYEEPVKLESSTGNSTTKFERYGSASLSYTYRVNDFWSSNLSYSDQTVLGSPANTSLSRIVQLQLRRSWQR